MCRGDNYKFHAAGREDIDVMKFYFLLIDCLNLIHFCAPQKISEYCAYLWNLLQVRMLGSGRPFLLEIQNSRQVPSEETVKEIESKINCLENKLVSSNTLSYTFVYKMI